VIVVPSSAPFVEEEYTAEDFTYHLKVSVQDMGSTAGLVNSPKKNPAKRAVELAPFAGAIGWNKNAHRSPPSPT
jgi:hypothetical protein